MDCKGEWDSPLAHPVGSGRLLDPSYEEHHLRIGPQGISPGGWSELLELRPS